MGRADGTRRRDPNEPRNLIIRPKTSERTSEPAVRPRLVKCGNRHPERKGLTTYHRTVVYYEGTSQDLRANQSAQISGFHRCNFEISRSLLASQCSDQWNRSFSKFPALSLLLSAPTNGIAQFREYRCTRCAPTGSLQAVWVRTHRQSGLIVWVRTHRQSGFRAAKRTGNQSVATVDENNANNQYNVM